MISLRVFFFVTLAVRGLDYVRADHPWNSPIYFVYMDKDLLYIDITLLKLPPRANYYVLYYQTDNCDENMRTEKYKQQGSQCYVLVKNGTIQTDELNFTQPLDKRSLRLYIEIGHSNSHCSTKIIMDGVKDEHADEVAKTFRAHCLNESYSRCKIYVDFGNQCEGKINCTQSNGRLTCKSPDEELPEDTVHQWYQDYGDGSSIGTIPWVKGQKSTFIIGFLKFDSSSYIYSKTNSAHWTQDLRPERFNIPANEYKEYDVGGSKTYSELEQVNFTCPNNAHTQIGWIDPTGYKITTYNVTSISRSFRKTDNNSMLCCLHYNTYDRIVDRSVDGITLLLYKESVKQDNVKDNTSSDLNNPQETQVTSSTALSTTPKKIDITSSPGSEAPQSSAEAKKYQDQQYKKPQTNLDQPQDSTSDKMKYYIVIPAVAGIIILISIIYVVIKKCYRKSSEPEQTLQLDTYASTNMVLYAELDIKPGNAPPPARTEDPTYAKIIGVLRPQNENVEK